MKKRLLSALLALALVFVLLPTTALAGETTYSDSEITISGKYWNFGNKGTSGEYAPVYFRSNGTAFEESEPTGSNYLEIRKTSANEITIKVHGTVDLTEDKNSTNSCISVNSAGMNKRNLIITGAAKGSTLNLTCKNYSHPLYSYEGSITINGGVTVNATSQYSNNNNNVSVYGIQVSNGHDLTISGTNTKVNVVNKTYDSTVKVNGNITVSDGAQLKAENKSGKVTGYTSKKAYAIECGQLSISGDKTQVTAYTGQGKKAINGTVNNGTANDDYKLTFKAGMYEGAPSFNYPKPMSEALEYAYVEITQAPTNPYVRIAGEPAIIGQETPIPGGTGTYRYDVGTGYNGDTLTLNNVTINKTSNNAAKAIQFDKNNGTYTVNLVGTNTISNVSYGISTNSAYSEATSMSVTITGSGSLDISAKAYAIEVPKGDLTFNGTGNITLTTNHNYVNPRNALYVAGSVTIDTTKYDITGEKPVVNPTTENLNGNPNLDTILKGTSTNTDLYFKTITITPAAPKKSTISYGGTTLKQGETIKDGKGGTATVATKGNTITLNNFKGTKALSFEATLADSTLVLEGTNTLSSIVTTQKGLTISGSGSLTVGSIKVHKEKSTSTTGNTIPNLTINGATVTVGNAEITDRAIDIDGNLTVENNATLTATSNSTKPTVQVGGNATFTGSTVTITNHSTALHKDATKATKGDSVSSALYVKGDINITDNANVTAKVENGGGNAIGALGNITVNGSNVTAVNKGQKFTTIIAKNVYVSGDSKITANNLNGNQDYNGWYLAFPAIEGNIVNKNTDYSLNFKGEHSSSSEPKTTLAPGKQTTLYYYNVTITCGDEVTSTQSPVVIDGTTLLNDTYYTITNGTVAEGTESNYNAFYDSETKTLKLNNAKISHSFAYEDGGGQDGAIIFKEFENYFIELSGENTISSTNTYAINCHRPDRTLTIKNAAEAENAKLTLTSNWMVICSIGGLNIQSDVTMVNTKRADYLMYVNGTFSYTGYNAYASTEASGSPLEVYNPQNYSTYKYLRITKENLAPTTPTTYTVTITAGDNMKHESGALTQEVTKGAAITEVKFMAASGHYFPADYVSKMNLPAGLTAEIRENSWYLIISGTPTSDVTINLPAASVRPTITVSMPTPVAGNTPATASNITLTYSDINKSISKNLTISNVVWQSYVPNGDGSITPGEALSSGDKFEAGKTYFVRVTHEYVAGDYDIVPAAGITLDYTESDSTYMMLLFYTTGAPCNHEYTNDWLANGNTHWHECKLCRAHAGEVAHTFGDWITDTPATDTTDGSKHRTCSVCQYQENATIPKTGTGEIVPPTPDNPGTIVIIRPAEEEKPAQQPNPSTGANDLVGLAVAAAVAAALGSAALLRKHD